MPKGPEEALAAQASSTAGGRAREECPDGPRRKAIGDGTAVPAMRRIGEGTATAEAGDIS